MPSPATVKSRAYAGARFAALNYRRRAATLALGIACSALCPAAWANSDALSGLVSAPGGAGRSYARGVPLLELRDQERNGRNTSRLLNYLDPTIDLSIGDLLGVAALEKTFAGLGVSHRSGIFGGSHLFGNVSGGSNYIYTYVEWDM